MRLSLAAAAAAMTCFPLSYQGALPAIIDNKDGKRGGFGIHPR